MWQVILFNTIALVMVLLAFYVLFLIFQLSIYNPILGVVFWIQWVKFARSTFAIVRKHFRLQRTKKFNKFIQDKSAAILSIIPNTDV